MSPPHLPAPETSRVPIVSSQPVVILVRQDLWRPRPCCVVSVLWLGLWAPVRPGVSVWCVL